MRSARLKIFVFSSLLAGILWASPVFAAEGGGAATESLKSDLADIRTRLTALEEGQKEIIAKEEKILEELDRIRIWVRRS